MTTSHAVSQAEAVLVDVQLGDIVRAAREHRVGPCRLPLCPGDQALGDLIEAGTGGRMTLLLAAIKQLAAQPPTEEEPPA